MQERWNANMKVVIVGGVAGGATAAARIRRLNEQAEIVVFVAVKVYFLCQLRSALLCRRCNYRSGRPDPPDTGEFLLPVPCEHEGTP